MLMTTKSPEDAVILLEEIKMLLELNGENPFKIRAFEKAARQIAGVKDLKKRAQAGTLTEIQGVGKGIAEVLTEFLIHGNCILKGELEKSLPVGLLELTEIAGLGPKKARLIIDTLDIHSLRELEYACKENRLSNIKGFGEKIQIQILKEIERINSQAGKACLGDVLDLAETLKNRLCDALNLEKGSPLLRVSETGELRRRCEILTKLEYLIEFPVELPSGSKLKKKIEETVAEFQKENPSFLPVQWQGVTSENFATELFRTTGSGTHVQAVGLKNNLKAFSREEDLYQSLDLPWIPPEARETGKEVELAKKGTLDLVDQVRGIFHNHTTRSDGKNSLEEMVVAAKELGFEYIGISDHSQSAFYAQGLKHPDLLDQENEIKEVQKKHPEIRVFWGIESDILADGSLDYENSILKRFDFVIASIHSRFKMDHDQMTQRILKAVRNPYTRFIGHLTGRLLLGREAFEADVEKIIEDAAEHNVAIELNANPSRLDIDWRYGDCLRKNLTPVSINPDAHRTSGLRDTRFGVMMSKKALLPPAQVVNTKSTNEIEKWLKRKK